MTFGHASLPRHKTLRYGLRKLTDIRSAAMHHSATKSGSPEEFARYQVGTNGWSGNAYHFVIGVIYWCNDPEAISYHVGNSNRHALGICLVGDFKTQQPTAAQIDATQRLLQYLQVQIPTMKQVGIVDKPKQIPVAIKLNEVLLAVTGFLQDGVSMLPVRTIANAAGGKVEWIEVTQDVCVNGNRLNKIVKLKGV
ncbi:N-acetylmuramoyl-L-alanine amidase [Brevibacillus brevis]|uniref:N-acetylmuramoyl-L-alanine amidase n=1 Tax=Brevibacillus brevis TaxID=1393 RepID=UPI0025A61083|nr:N-acetylmuramoyl-L-alanine amidase [Brevibacillus brevis]WJQ81599.1 N-acetylmuramoyl-L-alanine amidase [Brevibacillus brevis]